MWNELTKKLIGEDALLGTRITGSILHEMHSSGYAVAKIHKNTIVAFAALWETNDASWRELGSVWVCPTQRNHGLGSQIFSDCMHICSEKVFLITHNPKVVHLALRTGFSEPDVHNWFQVPYSITCKPCDRVSDRMNCRMRATPDCRLFFK